MKMNYSLITALIALISLSTACGDESENGVACPAVVVSSIRVTVVKEGAPAVNTDNVRVFSSLDDAELRPCDGGDSNFQCGTDGGDFAVFASDDEGHAGIAYVKVRKNSCHPVTEHIELELK